MIQTLKEATDIEDIVVSWKKKSHKIYQRWNLLSLQFSQGGFDNMTYLG